MSKMLVTIETTLTHEQMENFMREFISEFLVENMVVERNEFFYSFFSRHFSLLS